jgi:hypothetical protein
MQKILYSLLMGHHRHKHKHHQQKKPKNQFVFSRVEKTIFGLLANLSCPKRKFANEAELTNAKTNLVEFADVLENKAHTVGQYILHPDLREDFAMRDYADGFIEWATKI